MAKRTHRHIARAVVQVLVRERWSSSFGRSYCVVSEVAIGNVPRAPLCMDRSMDTSCLEWLFAQGGYEFHAGVVYRRPNTSAMTDSFCENPTCYWVVGITQTWVNLTISWILFYFDAG